jgi:hypothetical protein
VADARRGTAGAGRRWDGHQQCLDRPAGHGRRPAIPADRGRGGWGRPTPVGRGPAAGRSAEGRPPRQPDRHHRGVHRGRGAACRGGVGGSGQPVRPSRSADPGAARGGRCPGLPDRPRRDGVDRLPGRWPGRGHVPAAHCRGPISRCATRAAGAGRRDSGWPCALARGPGRVLVRHPARPGPLAGDRARRHAVRTTRRPSPGRRSGRRGPLPSRR